MRWFNFYVSFWHQLHDSDFIVRRSFIPFILFKGFLVRKVFVSYLAYFFLMTYASWVITIFWQAVLEAAASTV